MRFLEGVHKGFCMSDPIPGVGPVNFCKLSALSTTESKWWTNLWHVPLGAGQSCPRHPRAVGLVQYGADTLAGGDQPVHIDTGCDAQALKQIEHVFGGDIASGTFGVRTAAEARNRAVEYADAFQEAGVDIGQGLAVGVVKVPSQKMARDITGYQIEQMTSLARGAGADGVAQRHFVTAHGIERLGHAGHLRRGYIAFIGAAKHAGHIAAHANTLLFGGVHQWHKALEALADRAVDVFLRERFACCGKYRDFLDSGRQRVFETFQVGGQRRVSNTWQLLDLRKNLSAAGHLLHPLWRDKTAHLDIAESCGRQVVYQAHLVGHADRLFLVLQTVARADFDQAHLFG